MAKNLTRPGPRAIEAMLGVSELPISTVRLEDVVIRPGRNPRTLFLSDEERQTLFSPDGLRDLIPSMTAPMDDGRPRGVLQPLLMRPLGDGRYELVAGERRYHAARWSGLTEVPVVLRDLSDTEALEAAIIENGQRENPDVVSETFAGFQLMALRTGMTTEETVAYLNTVRLGRAEDTHRLDELLRQLFGTGVSTWSQQRANILKLQPAERTALQQGKLDAKALFALIRLGDHPERGPLLQDLLDLPERPSSQEVARRVADLLAVQATPTDVTAQRLRALLPRLRKLSPDQHKRVQKLLDQIAQLVEVG